MKQEIFEALSGIIPKENIHCNEPLSGYTSFQVGGPAKILLYADCVSQLQDVLTLLRKKSIPFMILGKGSNLLVSDEGYDGVVICPGEDFRSISCEGDRIRAGAGASLARVAALALQHGLTGFEFASGIPGTVGGAMVMNAGAYDGEMKQVVESVSMLNEAGEEVKYSCEEMEFDYRTSILKREPFIVTEVVFKLQPGERDEIEEKMRTFAHRRKEKQPLEYPSAGSTFKRPQGHFAGKLIGDAGLSGYTIGGAQVSEKHNGFIINKGGATAAQISALIEHVQTKVKEDSGVLLEPEVIYVGRM